MNVGGDLGLAMRLVLDGNAQSEMLIDAATSALVEGLDSPSLRALAGLLVRDAPYDGQRLAERALDELGLLLADSRAASRAVARSWSRAILDGTAKPLLRVRRFGNPSLVPISSFPISLRNSWR